MSLAERWADGEWGQGFAPEAYCIAGGSWITLTGKEELGSMKPMMTLLGACLVLAGAARADFSYRRTSQMTGGSLAKMMRMVPGGKKALEPTSSDMLFQRDRMAMVAAEAIDIVDIGARRMTHIDLANKTYSTITFEEFRQALAAIEKKAARQTGKQDVDMKMDMRFEVKDTGETKVFEGMQAKLMKLMLAMDMTDAKTGQTLTTNFDTDSWLAPEVAGYGEVRRFYERYAEEVGLTPEMMGMSRMILGQKGTAEGMAKLMKEASKLQGVPLFQVSRITGLGMPGMEGMPDVQMPSGGDVAGAAAGSAVGSAAGRLGGRLGGALGGLGGLGRRKKQEAPPAQPPAEAAKKGEVKPAVLMEVTSKMSNFSTAPVDKSRFEIPAGFKEVEHEMKKAAR